MIQETRIQSLNRRSVQNREVVLYWMQASQRAAWNHALEFAIREANRLHRPVAAYFGLTDRFPEANARHFAFMLEGLMETAASLKERGITLIVRREPPESGVVRLAKKACLVVTDRGYSRIQRTWRRKTADGLDCPLIQVESDVIVPVETASAKLEYSAATFRPRITRQLPAYLADLENTPLQKDSLGTEWSALKKSNPWPRVNRLDVDQSVTPVTDHHRGGAEEAHRRLAHFLEKKMADYAEQASDPARAGLSGLSPYLHFGQISPLEIALAARRKTGRGTDAFLEELIVRRELSMNFVYFNADYDDYANLPEWCRKTLAEHSSDPRPYRYSPAQLERAETHDPYWNAAQLEMCRTGKMHGYMRMYWGKKILEWSKRPETAYRTALALNNRWELDGRDPNGFAGVAWCFGRHDRAWGERPVFGKVRSMTAAGLKRKFDIESYVRRVAEL